MTGVLPLDRPPPRRYVGPEVIVDCFAGGGGASLGIEMATGRSPDVAINHDPFALALHRENHPETLHLTSNVWRVDPMEVLPGRRVGLLWASPDCKDFSKAKGGRPASPRVRDLAWVVVLWARLRRPRLIALENVEEFREWGPLLVDGRRCPERKGQIFLRWVGALRRLGYRVEWRELRGCDYGAPTIRRRLFVIARCDGRPIVWPEPTHGRPDDPEVLAGRRLPWRTAAECIDWCLPCPSIFDTAAQIKERHGVRAKRPLASATLARIARGVKRYVLDAADPFIVPVTHQGDLRSHSVDEPMRTQTTAKRGEHALVTPFVTKFRKRGVGHSIGEPLATVTANGHSARPGGAVPLGLVAASLVQTGYGEREGQAPRSLDIEAPLGTQVAGGCKHAVVASFVARQFGNSIGHRTGEPVGTITSGGAGKAALVAAFLAQHNEGSRPGRPAHDARDPVSTITAAGSQQGIVQADLVAAHQISLKGRDRRDAALGEPIGGLCAGGNHAGAVYAFLQSYYGTDQAGGDPSNPLPTDTGKPRFGLVTVEIGGEQYAIVDIGMRMLTPRERFRAQGFPDRYRIAEGVGPNGETVPLTLEVQGAACGNSVCPPLAAAIVQANYVDCQARDVAGGAVEAAAQ